MATYDQLMNAARNAHAAGDEESARRLVQRAKAMRGGDVVAEVNGGRVVRQQDGSLAFTSPGYATTDQDTIRRLMEGEGVKSVVQSGFDQQTIAQAPITARAVKAMEGVPFLGSRIDEAAGMVSQGFSKLGIGEGRAEQGVRAVSEAMQRERPGQSMGLSLAGGITSSIPMAAAAIPAIRAAAPMSRAGRVLLGGAAGTTAGAIEGGVYGSGLGDGSERVENARQGAQIGAGLGLVAGAAGPFVADVTDAALRALKGTDVSAIAKRFGISKKAAEIVKNNIAADDMAAARAALQRSGNDAMLAEATPGGAALLDAVAARGGAAGNIVNDAIEGRVRSANRQVTSVLDDALGQPPIGRNSALDDIATRSAPQRQAAYSAAYSQPINYASPQGAAIEEVLGRIQPRVLRNAVEKANARMLANGQRNMQILLDLDTGALREMPNVQQLDELKRALDQMARDSMKEGRATADSLLYGSLAKQVREATTDAVPEYRTALAIGGDKIAEDNALRAGADFLKPSMTRDDVIRTMAGASKDAREAAKVGVRSAIDETMARVRSAISDPNVEAREVRKLLADLSSRNNREKLEILLGPKEAKRIFDELDRVSGAFQLRANVSENSKTARRTLINREIADQTAPNVVETALSGEPVNAGKRAVQLLTGEGPEAQALRESGVAEEIARFLTGVKGRSAETALQYVNQVVRGQKLTNAQANFVANMLATSGFLAGNRQGQLSLAPQ